MTLLTGIPLGCVSLAAFVYTGSEMLFYNNDYNNYKSNLDLKSIFIVTLAGIVVGFGCLVTGGIIKNKRKRHLANAITYYNQSIKIKNGVR